MVEANEQAPERRANLERILEAALRVFARCGYTGASLNDVAAEAGLTKPTVYNYFESKATLYEEMLRWFHQRMMERFEAAVAPHQTAYDRILALLRAKITFATEYADLIRVFHSLMFLPEELRPRFNPMPFWEQRFGLILEVVREGVASGELRGDPMDISFVISGSFWTLAATQALFPALPVLQPGLDERLWDVIYHGVRGR